MASAAAGPVESAGRGAGLDETGSPRSRARPPAPARQPPPPPLDKVEVERLEQLELFLRRRVLRTAARVGAGATIAYMLVLPRSISSHGSDDAIIAWYM
jgi:hypothetical protein